MMAYAEYFGVDGSADDDLTIGERIVMHRGPLVDYASRTGTRRNLVALRAAGWLLLVSAAGVLRTEGMSYALDNSAWTAYQQGQAFDEDAFMRALDKAGADADWIVLPDIVAGGLRSQDYSLTWLERLRGLPRQLLIAVQDGMEIDDVRVLLSPAVGIFVGGSTQWKGPRWVRGDPSHVGATAICMSVGSIRFRASGFVRPRGQIASMARLRIGFRYRFHRSMQPRASPIYFRLHVNRIEVAQLASDGLSLYKLGRS
ncbi:hypothetical protein [Burkholderia stagnalis]|uniref:hypothetical protein n=1 Tax=Burkholderia stagnalis TaxID=1503054 RepID=UPI0016249440|nr:hypothetical protein [Burkholderia stagnalis]